MTKWNSCTSVPYLGEREGSGAIIEAQDLERGAFGRLPITFSVAHLLYLVHFAVEPAPGSPPELAVVVNATVKSFLCPLDVLCLTNDQTELLLLWHFALFEYVGPL
uniref:Uncharacterized protein n=1 Tax=Physcomitrium patens TaxID=3218 RepID=A0A2K1L6D4_PHYPA|nr:hypothetical protein PHYPA_000026 [Physcomitrium patens]